MSLTMTNEEIEAERITSLASACFSEWTILLRSEHYLQQTITRHWDHSAFQKYMTDMGLVDQFARFRSPRKGGERAQ